MQVMLEEFLFYFEKDIIAQSIGLLALFFNIVGFITIKDKRVLIFFAISAFFWFIHMYLLGLYSGAFVALFDVFKNLIALKYKRTKKIIFFFVISYLLIGVFTFQKESLYSIIPIVNSLLSIYFVFFLRGIKLKIGYLVISVLWLVYSIFGHSIGGIISDIILIISGFIGIFKVLKERTKDS